MWFCAISRDNSSLILNFRPHHADVAFTTAQLCELLRSSQDIRDGVQDVSIGFGEEIDCPDQDLEAVGNALHDLQRLDELTLGGSGSPSDAKLSALLRHVPTTKIRSLRIGGKLGESCRFPSVITELQQAEWLASLTKLAFTGLYLDERDCDTLGQLLRPQQEEKPWINFFSCTFPSLKGYLVVADALIEFGHICFHFRHNTVKDARIPSSVTSSTHREFYRRLEREEDDDEARFNSAAEGHLKKYHTLNNAGRLALLDPDHEATDEQWLDALGDWRIIDNVDYLFYFLRLNPAIIHAQSRSKRKLGGGG